MIQTGFYEQRDTLADAKRAFSERVDKGSVCPCCDRYGKRYRRKLNAGMARMLIGLYRIDRRERPEGGWIHVSKKLLGYKISATDMEYSKLRFWGLIEERTTDNAEVPGSGWWRLTGLGTRFVEDGASIPRHVFVYDNRFFGFSDETTTIRQALGDKFDYKELIEGA